MAKRFIDTKIWDKAWFRKLTSKNKLLWIYILTKCDHAGIWDSDWEAAEFFIGEKVSFKGLPKQIQDKMQYIKGDDQYFVPSFIEFQYGTLRENSKPHLSVLKRLNEKSLLNSLESVQNTLKDKDKNKVKKKDKTQREKEFQMIVFNKAKEIKELSKIQIENFISYWTESNEYGKKMKFEMQKTFDIKRRLIKWRDNNIEWKKIAKKPIQTIESKFDKVKSGSFYKAWCSKCGKKEMPSTKWDLQKGSSCCAVEYDNKEPEKEINFNEFAKSNPKAKGLNHLSKYLK